jgi:hypothetical protein
MCTDEDLRIRKNEAREWLNEMGIVVSTTDLDEFGGGDISWSPETDGGCGDRAA